MEGSSHRVVKILKRDITVGERERESHDGIEEHSNGGDIYVCKYLGGFYDKIITF